MNQANYLLIDGVLRPDAIKRVYQYAEPVEVMPLYLGTRWSKLMNQGPVLVKAQHASSLIREWVEPSGLPADSSLFCSNACLKTVATHLRHFLCPLDHLGNSSLLRFADPLVMYYWLSSYSREHLSHVLGPIDQLWVQVPRHGWQLPPSPIPAKFVNEYSGQPWQQDFALLGEPQLQALKESYRWLFEERIHAWLQEQDPQAFANQTEDQITTWLTQTVESGLEWGLVSEYALATWADLCREWGLDFVSRPHPTYQLWQTQNPKIQHLPPELRIDSLDEYRQKLDTSKGMLHDR
ncbi:MULTISPECIES: DUF4123 domain-containing protein [Pseudomonas syringae group]|uniref:DUF4123 domain-containing protein n=1 Tax=Pseudomonas syringae group TaxID=136849 RepID=UPI000EFFFC00|nr:MULTISPECIES: DUF4123 domain-containing protein [Pseudomonas syringae group]MCF5715001.1 DUF4123 domain-containing protein [Pseudomonas tremae]MCF5747551.1 DUF4123 domain-containing protein [Pseudomonas tremae]RMP25530.1 hypothetical protein ALQ25_03277 [Pseudomonas coronafaciens pv. atropurpurea]UQB33814.1 DUF4123 domain-containing protein [Pseudomonas tremae]UQB34710.1 DUF4123 domain-containing protein [Pseudomonas tremae]